MLDFILPILGIIPKVLLAYCVYNTQYPKLLIEAKDWNQDWIFMVLFRNIIGTLIICCSWDWLLYLSPMKEKFHPYKFNTNYPPTTQLLHDMIWTLSSSFWGSVLECIALHFWATGVLPYLSNFFGEHKMYNILSVVLV